MSKYEVEQQNEHDSQPLPVEQTPDPNEYERADEPLTDEEMAKLLEESGEDVNDDVNEEVDVTPIEGETNEPSAPVVINNLQVVSIASALFIHQDRNSTHPQVVNMHTLIRQGYKPFAAVAGEHGNHIVYLFKE